MYTDDKQLAVDEPSMASPSYPFPQSWHAKLPLYLEQSGYTINTADSLAEFEQVMALRQEVFLQEFAELSWEGETHDYEPIDQHADFLIIKNRDEIVATYRLICSKFSEQFYSQTEFQLEPFLTSPGIKLELSRACVRKSSRASIALHLLWRGIAEYMMRTGARYLFGCSSIKSLDLPSIIEIYRFLHAENAIDDKFDIKPRQNYHIIDTNGFIGSVSSADKQTGIRIDQQTVPPLFWGYLKAGAKVYGPPALDINFGCLDFFTILDFNRLSSSYLRKYIKSHIQ